jgi:hypothetical protein
VPKGTPFLFWGMGLLEKGVVGGVGSFPDDFW